MNLAKGCNPSLQEMQAFTKAPNFKWEKTHKKGYFTNLNPKMPHIKRASLWEVLRFYLFKPKNAKPKYPLPFIKTDFKSLYTKNPAVVWFGHSSLLINDEYFKILIDPVFSSYASPKAWINRAFESNVSWSSDDFESIDALVITHDHYDHLDYPTIMALKDKVKHFIVPLGVGSHLRFWGVPFTQITELYWWQSLNLTPSIKITSTPSQHSSGRGIQWDRTLWTSYVLDIKDKKIFLSGDGGYYTHFKQIGERFGSIDLAILENGQYNLAWQYSHSFTPQVFQTALDLKAKMIMPIHYGRFAAGSHAWNEPLKNLISLCDTHCLPISVPKIGEVYELNTPPKREIWWDF
ncbi:MBL fold metallo-hydrolase [Helicobacter sp. MIT 21-1697]|uniref:MBL fold metallo-hydrolase n=1 Tax=Helicobacter sp. MIT 21-1697 TaxID=2993733 RepID=UPI00224AD028|nr:MBL fold metallo-hydrolase [Helicobacter sp. MIT 21-1697]MCX2716861.1 MBL fold metallo-hydrolase [Helicobacter sp. MIT 21-1697]